ncbi:MAG TPA: hypothetical protein VFY87_31585 [Geminicoccaceae bacterium]|jgi:exodeoxyribonuclease V alpha subunit|nr:hypothetical protein [Geminicoccaceae bacterium]
MAGATTIAQTSSSPPPREALAGLVERVTFHNPENGFCVLRVKVRGRRELVTVVGAPAAISPGEFIEASGGWERPDSRAPFLRAVYFKTAPTTGAIAG